MTATELNLTQLADALPDYAKDLRVNLQNVLAQQELTPQQTWTVAVACALASRNKDLSQAVVAEASTKLSPEQLNSAKAAFAIMGMNNIFYRFRHMAANEELNTLPARLRMQSIRTHGGDPVDFELACLAVSSINGCEACVKAHEQTCRQKGVSSETILAAIRIASTVHAVAGVADFEV